ncbi:DUF4349 domain-containing protein [Streptomyces sp. KR80]|uniref:DUF4349 domain-containing protein n=1 Tax=Streptomyces sp. KR80 TaxID=3457426 RepID=UPI003FCFE9FB
MVATLGLTGCSAGSDTTSSGVAQSDARQDKGAAPGLGPDRAATGAEAGAADGKRPGGRTDRKPPKLAPSHVIRTARLTVQVKDVPTALDDARTTAETAGGYVGDETTDRDEQGRERSRVVLRIPQEKYESVLEDLSGAGKLIERKADARDVTDQVVDVESRIRSQEASVARVRKLMEQATQLTDVVTLEGELSTRQAELEALKAQQQSLADRTAMSTITLVLSESEVKPKPQGDDETSFTDALAGGWDAFVTTLRWIAVAVGAVLPFAVALTLLGLIWRAARSRLPRRTTAPRGTTPPPPVTVPAPLGAPDEPERHTEKGS